MAAAVIAALAARSADTLKALISLIFCRASRPTLTFRSVAIELGSPQVREPSIGAGVHRQLGHVFPPKWPESLDRLKRWSSGRARFGGYDRRQELLHPGRPSFQFGGVHGQDHRNGRSTETPKALKTSKSGKDEPGDQLSGAREPGLKARLRFVHAAVDHWRRRQPRPACCAVAGAVSSG